MSLALAPGTDFDAGGGHGTSDPLTTEGLQVAWRVFNTVQWLLDFVAPPSLRRAIVRQLAVRYAQDEKELAFWLRGGPDDEEAFFDAIEAAESVGAIPATCAHCHNPYKRDVTVQLVAPTPYADAEIWARDARSNQSAA